MHGLMVKNRSEGNTKRKAPIMGKMNQIHLETEELVLAVGTALQENSFNTFETAGDVADQLAARGWKSPTENDVERKRMVNLLAALTDASHLHGPHSSEADAIRGDIILQVITDHQVTTRELAGAELVPA